MAMMYMKDKIKAIYILVYAVIMMIKYRFINFINKIKFDYKYFNDIANGVDIKELFDRYDKEGLEYGYTNKNIKYFRNK